MDFFRAIRSSLYDPVFYQAIRTQSLRPAVTIFSILGLAGFGLVMIIGYGALASFAFSDVPSKVEAAYPTGLVVIVANGEMSINQPEPYYVKNTLAEDASSSPRYFAIFDTNDELRGDASANSTLVLVKKKYALSDGGSDNEGKVISFAGMRGTTTIDKQDIVGVVEKIRPYFAGAVLIGGALMVVVGDIFATAFWVLFHMLYVLFPAALIFLFCLARGSRLALRESYMIALYASIPIVIISYLCALLGIESIPFAYTLLLVLIAVINVSKDTSAPIDKMSAAKDTPVA